MARSRVVMSLMLQGYQKHGVCVCVCVCVCVLVVGGRGQEGIKDRIQGKKLTRTTEGINTLDIQP